MADATLNKIFEGCSDEVISIAFSPDNKLIASASNDRTVRLWTVQNGDLNAELKGHEGKVLSVAFSPDGQSIVTGSGDSTVRTWSVATKQQVLKLNGHDSCVYSVAWSPNDELIASGSLDTTVILWDAISGSAKKKLTGHTQYVRSVSFSQNGNKLASAGGFGDKTAIIWDVNSGAALIKLAHSQAVYSVCFSRDDRFVVTGCDDKIVRMFDVNTGREEKRFEGHTSWVNSVACSFDGSMIASGSDDKSVRLWDVASSKQLQQLYGHTDRVNSVAFSRDDKFIASGSDDKTVSLRDLPILLQLRQIEILSVAQAIRTNRMVLKRANLLVLGDSEAGKTSLVDAFQGNFDKVVPDRSRTDTFDETSVAVKIASSGQQSHEFVAVTDILQPVIISLHKATVSRSVQPNPLPADNPEAISSLRPVTIQLATVAKNVEEEKKRVLDDLVVSEVVEQSRKKPRVSQDGEHMLVISDFAGQEEYRHAHPVFLQRPGLFIVCFNLKLAFDRSKNEASLDSFITESIDFWLFSILTFACANNTQDGVNSIFLVATHVDQVYNSFWLSPYQHTAHFIQQLQTKLCDRYKRISSLWERLYHAANSNNLNVFLSIDSTNKCESISQLPLLRKHIFYRLDSMSAEYPAEWLKLEYRIRTLHESFMGVNELLERINKERWALSTRGGTDVSHEELNDALRYLAQLGTILYFDDLPGEQQSGLSQLVIRSTNFVVKQLQYVINLPNRLVTIYRNTAPPQKDFKRMLNEGRISMKLLAFIQSRIRADNPELGLEKASDDLLPNLLLRFQLCFEQKNEEERVLWCPALFKPLTKRKTDENAKSFWERIMDLLISSKLVEPTDISFWLEIEYVPQGLFTRLLSHVMSTWPNARHQKLYREQAEIKACIDDISATVVFARVGNKLIQVFVKPSSENVIPYYKIRQLTENAVDTISKRWFPNLTWNIGIWQQNCLLPFKIADKAWLEQSEAEVYCEVNFDLRLFKQCLPSRNYPPVPPVPAPTPTPTPALAPAPAPAPAPAVYNVKVHEIPRRELNKDTKLSEGKFGIVWRGTYNGIPIAIKEPKLYGAELNPKKQLADLIEEATVMTSISNHPNVLHCYGMSRVGKDDYLLVTELCNLGSMDSFLRAYPGTPDVDRRRFSQQVVRGLNHLGKHNVAHRDVAARNVLLHDQGGGVIVVKVCDFGLSRQCKGEYYKLTGQHLLSPETAPEVFTTGKHSSRSDVWSFGVLLWEVESLCATRAVPDTQAFPPLPKPAQANDNMYAIMLKCWAKDPYQRPSFEALIGMLA